MALFYFNVHDDDVTFGDEAFELVDEEAAREFAITAVRGLAAEGVLQGHFTCSYRIEYADDHRHCLGYVRFDEAVSVIDGRR